LAENLLILSQEQVFAYAQVPVHFKDLEKCNFDGSNVCGFPALTAEFKDFKRFLVVSAPTNSTEFKQAHIQITWTELGNPQVLDASELLAKPPDSLPGNVIGTVTDSVSGAVLDGVQIKVQEVGAPHNAVTSSGTTVFTDSLGHSGNYTFAVPGSIPGTVQFTLDPVPATWVLTATKVGYAPFTSENFQIPSSKDYKDFTLLQLPVDAFINVSLSAPLPFNGNSSIHLYQGGIDSQQAISGANSAKFTIHFTNTDQQCFTVATRSAFRSGLAGNFSWLGWPVSNFQADGDSSALDPSVAPAQAGCSSINWVGGTGCDNICVKPGDNKPVPLSLVKVPTATISGAISDKGSAPIAGEPVTIIVHWHNNDAFSQTISNTNSYTISAPAEQELFLNTSSFFALLIDKYNVSQLQCCNQNAAVTQTPLPQPVGPLMSGDQKQQTLFINTNPANTMTCGNADGNIIDATTAGAVPGAVVSVFNLNQTTDGSGSYLYQCPIISQDLSFLLLDQQLQSAKIFITLLTLAAINFITQYLFLQFQQTP